MQTFWLAVGTVPVLQFVAVDHVPPAALVHETSHGTTVSDALAARSSAAGAVSIARSPHEATASAVMRARTERAALGDIGHRGWGPAGAGRTPLTQRFAEKPIRPG